MTKDAPGKILSLFKLAHYKGILPYTFQKYACKDKAKRQKDGVQAGRKSIISDNNTAFLAGIFFRVDRENDGLTLRESISTLQYLEPKLTHIQAQQYFDQTFFKKNAGKVKKRLAKAQQTTTKRSQITVAHKYRWF